MPEAERSAPDQPHADQAQALQAQADQAQARPAAGSHVTLTQLMEVTDTNIAGNVHGGVIMRLADTAAAIAAIRHARKLCVTVSVDELTFLEPVNLGDLVTVRASVNDVGTTSLECGVRVDAERPITGARVHAATAYFVFVALDDDGKPTPVPPLLVETDVERRRQREAKLRRAARMAHKEALRAQRRDGGGTTGSAGGDDAAPSERG